MIKIDSNIDTKRKYEIHIFGDSHSKCFFRDKSLSIDNIKLYNNYKSSASMKGLTNTDSTLDYSKTIEKILKQTQPSNSDVNTFSIMKFGQVDVEYNYYFKVYNKKESINKKEFYKNLVNNYMVYIDNLKILFPNIKFIINGLNMPNLYDLQKYMFNGGVRTMPVIDYENQFDNHFLFNNELKIQSELKKIPYFDLTTETTHNKKIKNEFIGKDNHLSGAEGEPYTNFNTYRVFLNKLFDTIKTN